MQTQAYVLAADDARIVFGFEPACPELNAAGRRASKPALELALRAGVRLLFALMRSGALHDYPDSDAAARQRQLAERLVASQYT